MFPHLSPSSHGPPPSMMVCIHGHVQQSAHAVLDLRAPCHYMERRRFRRRGRNADKSRRYVDEVMRQVRAQTTDARDDAHGAGIPNQLPEHEPCSNVHDAYNDWVIGHSCPRLMRRRRLTQTMMMISIRPKSTYHQLIPSLMKLMMNQRNHTTLALIIPN